MDANKAQPPGRTAVPLAILPGLMCDSRMFGGQVAAFGAQVVDGFYDAADRIEAMADRALACLPERCALLGHSMGARVALEIWRRAPERIERLLLADTGVHGVGAREAEGRYELRDIGREHGFATLARTWLGRMIGPAHRADAALARTLEAMCGDAGLRIYEAQIAALLARPECLSLLPTIDCPAFVVVGRDDEWAPVRQHEAIAAEIPHAQMRIVENAGHMAPAEEPELFNAVVGEWLAWPPTPSIN